MVKPLTRLERLDGIGCDRFIKGRASRIANILTEFYDPALALEAAAESLMADLMHLCTQRNLDFAKILHNGSKHHITELGRRENG